MKWELSLSTPKRADLVRRMVTWALAVVVMEEARSYQDVAGAMIVFGTQWLRNKYANNNNNSTRSLSTPEYNVVGNHKKQQNDLPVANRNRSFSADSYTTARKFENIQHASEYSKYRIADACER
jgi:hypothetical protein